jgi:excinuclease ABC subunit A
MEFFDPARVVAFPTLSLASGAIKGWDRRNGYYFAMLESLAKHYKFDIEHRLSRLPQAVQHAVLHGSGEEEIKFSYVMDSGAPGQEAHAKNTRLRAFCPIWRAATARPTRWWCAKTWPATAAPSPARSAVARACARGTPREDWRRRAGARHLEVSHFTLRESLDYFTACTCTGAKGEIAEQGGARDRPAPEVS